MNCFDCGSNDNLKRCSACKYALYCSKECQKNNFETHHKNICCLIPQNVTRITDNVVLKQQYVVVDRIIDAVCEIDQEPFEQGVNWVNIPAPPNSVANASFWRTFNFNKRRVCLGEIGLSVQTTRQEEIAENNQKRVNALPDWDMIIPPQQGYKIVNIQEIRLTKKTEKPAFLQGQLVVEDENFQLYRNINSPRSFIYWINRNRSMQKSVLYGRGPTVPNINL